MVEMEKRFMLWKSFHTLERRSLLWNKRLCDNLYSHVTSLNLKAFQRLRGKLDSSECELQHLTFLNLDYNDLEGKIPKMHWLTYHDGDKCPTQKLYLYIASLP